MLSPVTVSFVGEEQRGYQLLRQLGSHLYRPVNLLTTEPEHLQTVLSDDIDCVVCDRSVTADQLQTVVNALSNYPNRIPLIERSGAVAAVPDGIDVHYLAPDTDSAEATEGLLSVVLDSMFDADTDTISRFPGAYLAVDDSWRVRDIDPTLASWNETTPSALIGNNLFELFPSWENSTLGEACREAVDTGEQTAVVVGEAIGRPLEAHLTPREDGGLECFLSERIEPASEASSQRSESEQDSSAASPEPDAIEHDDTLERITDAFVALDNEDRFVYLNSKAASLLDVDPESVIGVQFWDTFPAAMTSNFYAEFTEAMETQQPTRFEEYYRPSESWFEVTAHPSPEGLSIFFRDITARVELRQKLEALQEVSQDLIVAGSDIDVAQTAITAAEDILGFPLAVVWRHDGSTEQLNPLAYSDDIPDEEMNPLGPKHEFLWRVFEAGDHRLLGSGLITTATSHHPKTAASELLVPISDAGVLGAYSPAEDAFDDTDVELCRLLASTVASAFARTKRERQLAQRNERLNDFASIVSHDLRNPLNVASLHADLARRDADPESHLDKIETSLERMNNLIDDLLARARGDQELAREHVSLATTARTAWSNVDTGNSTLDIDADVTLSADKDRLVQAFENLFRNSVEHGSTSSRMQSDDSVEHSDGSVTVRVGHDDQRFFVADDGPGIPPEQRADIFEQGVSHSETGTGYGLAIVADIVDGHGWDIRVTESAAGGARFDITGVSSIASEQWAE